MINNNLYSAAIFQLYNKGVVSVLQLWYLVGRCASGFSGM